MLDTLGEFEGCRLAEAGEFTRRAFENGRLDLTAVEGLGDLLAAQTETQRRHAIRIAEGGLAAKIAEWRRHILACAAAVEALLDFSDEGDVEEVALASRIAALDAEMSRLIAQPSSERLQAGVEVVIAGPPNSGKSTLLNALVGREAAITSPHAGTTRDLVQVPAVIDGLPVRITDSAGLRTQDADEVERIGIERAERAIALADIVLWLGDEPPPTKAIWVHSRADLPGRGLQPPECDVMVSAATGLGLSTLAKRIGAAARLVVPAEDVVALNDRQRAEVVGARDALRLGIVETDPLLLSEALRQALLALDRLRGASYAEEMLDQLFSRFCIGK